jgi:hypothetical protein
MISDALGSILRSGRDQFNATFAEGRRRFPELDAGAFNEFLRTTLDSLARQTAALPSEQQVNIVITAYEAGLELVGERQAGSDSRSRIIEAGWNQILPAILPLLAAAPSSVLSAISNALHTLSTSPGARPEQWIKELRDLGPRCPDLPTFLKLGQVLAWRAGLAHFRQGALDAAQALPEALAVAAVGGPSTAQWPALYQRLANDSWFDPAPSPAGSAEKRGLRLAAQVGAFRGFGGSFIQTPEVASTGDQLLVRSGDECWWLLADAFGATLHRATVQEFDLVKHRNTLPENVHLTKSKISRGAETLPNPAPEGANSFASFGQTLALTSAVSYRVSLVAL